MSRSTDKLAHQLHLIFLTDLLPDFQLIFGSTSASLYHDARGIGIIILPPDALNGRDEHWRQ